MPIVELQNNVHKASPLDQPIINMNNNQKKLGKGYLRSVSLILNEIVLPLFVIFLVSPFMNE